MKKQALIWVATLIICVALTGCGDIIGGTYTRDGDNASLVIDEDSVGTAKVTDGTMTVTAVEKTLSLTQSTIKSNHFRGIWVGQYADGSFFEVAIGNSLFCVYPYEGGVAAAKYSLDGENNAVVYIEEGDELGRATVKGNKISATIEDETYTISKKSDYPVGSCSSLEKNPFLGTWTGSVEGYDVEIVVGEQAWGARMFEK